MVTIDRCSGSAISSVIYRAKSCFLGKHLGCGQRLRPASRANHAGHHRRRHGIIEEQIPRISRITRIKSESIRDIRVIRGSISSVTATPRCVLRAFVVQLSFSRMAGGIGIDCIVPLLRAQQTLVVLPKATRWPRESLGRRRSLPTQ